MCAMQGVCNIPYAYLSCIGNSQSPAILLNLLQEFAILLNFENFHAGNVSGNTTVRIEGSANLAGDDVKVLSVLSVVYHVAVSLLSVFNV
jgi:hypothetical protein